MTAAAFARAFGLALLAVALSLGVGFVVYGLMVLADCVEQVCITAGFMSGFLVAVWMLVHLNST